MSEIRYDKNKVTNILRGESPRVFVAGFNKKKEKNITNTIVGKDGKTYEVFIENDKEYVYRDGVKISKRLIESDSSGVLPLFCPKCNRVMKSSRDSKMYSIHQICFACTIKVENDLRISGKWHIYEQQKVLSNKISFIKEMLTEINNIINNGVDDVIKYVNEDGSLEKWKNNSKEKIEEFLNTEKEKLEEELKKSEDELIATGDIINVTYAG